MIYKETKDAELIKSVVIKVYHYSSDDFSPKPEDWEPVFNESVHYVLTEDSDGEILCIFVLIKRTELILELHTCMVPNTIHKRKTIPAMTGIMQWVWENFPIVTRLVTEVPSYNRLALNYGLRCGFVEYGNNPKSYMKNGILYDVVLLGVTRPETKVRS